MKEVKGRILFYYILVLIDALFLMWVSYEYHYLGNIHLSDTIINLTVASIFFMVGFGLYALVISAELEEFKI